MALAYWIEYFDHDDKLIQRDLIRWQHDARLAFGLAVVALNEATRLLPSGTVRVDLIHSTDVIDSAVAPWRATDENEHENKISDHGRISPTEISGR